MMTETLWHGRGGSSGFAAQVGTCLTDDRGAAGAYASIGGDTEQHVYTVQLDTAGLRIEHRAYDIHDVNAGVLPADIDVLILDDGIPGRPGVTIKAYVLCSQAAVAATVTTADTRVDGYVVMDDDGRVVSRHETESEAEALVPHDDELDMAAGYAVDALTAWLEYA